MRANGFLGKKSGFILHGGSGLWRLFCAVALSGVLSAACSTMANLPGGLSSPDHGVVCDSRRGVCFDRFGPSIGLTGVFLGPGAAQALTAALRETPPARDPDAAFSPGDNIACRRVTGPCRTGDVVHQALTTVLYGPRLAGLRGASAVVGIDWQ